MKPLVLLLLAAATADDDVLLRQLTHALGKPATPKALAETFVDERLHLIERHGMLRDRLVRVEARGKPAGVGKRASVTELRAVEVGE